ncbi:MAG: RNA methyltransferase, partial [Oscillospiraceae bacterium]|nr:RNA methyltransferase [Oscillospiraceae bacterium]
SDALSSGVNFDFLLLTKKCFYKIKNTPYDITKLCKYELISDKLAKSISHVDSPQGAFGIASKISSKRINEMDDCKNILALHNVQDPGNVGTLIRTADAFGFDTVVVSGGCDVYNPKVLRSTMGSLFRISIIECPDFESFLKDINVKTYAAVVDRKANHIDKIKFDGGMLIIGNEANGLPKKIYDICDEKITINMFGNTESLNAAIAGGICMYQMRQSMEGN